MAHPSDRDAECARLLHRLCSIITGLPADAVSPLYEECSHILGRFSCSHFVMPENDESQVAERINRSFIREHKEKEAVRFSDLHRRLRSPALQGVLQNRALVLAFLLEMKGKGSGGGQPSCRLPSTDGRLLPVSLSRSHPPQPLTTAGRGREQRMSCVFSSEPAVSMSIGRASSAHESEVTRGTVYALHGVSSCAVRFSDTQPELIVDPEGVLSTHMRSLAGRMAELGALVRRIDGFCKHKQARRGLLSDALVGALQVELTEYYRLLALPDGQASGAGEPAVGGGATHGQSLTLYGLTVLMREALETLRVLACLVKACQGLKGGMLASRMHAFLANGNPDVSALVRRLLVAVLHPWYGMLCRWVQTGQLEDVYHEATSNAVVPAEGLWHDKYYLRKNMVPSFLSEAQARKILCTGKAVNFLLHVCQDQPTGALLQDSQLEARTGMCVDERVSVKSWPRNVCRRYDTDPKQAPLLCGVQSHHLVRRTIPGVAKLRLFMGPSAALVVWGLSNWNSRDQALSPFMKMLQQKRGKQNRTCKITIVRCRLRIAGERKGGNHRSSPGLVVSSSPLSSFPALAPLIWRESKKSFWGMDWQPAACGKSRHCWSKTGPKCPGMMSIPPVARRNLRHAVGIPATLAVIECAWAELETRVDQAQDLDEVVKAHDDFLSALMTRALLDPESRDILSELRSIFDQVLRFKEVQERLLTQLEQTRTAPGGGGKQPRTQRSVISEAQAAVRVISDTYQVGA
ncbi:unnamed protein product [Ixodes hexagonus]